MRTSHLQICNRVLHRHVIMNRFWTNATCGCHTVSTNTLGTSDMMIHARDRDEQKFSTTGTDKVLLYGMYEMVDVRQGWVVVVTCKAEIVHVDREGERMRKGKREGRRTSSQYERKRIQKKRRPPPSLFPFTSFFLSALPSLPPCRRVRLPLAHLLLAWVHLPHPHEPLVWSPNNRPMCYLHWIATTSLLIPARSSRLPSHLCERRGYSKPLQRRHKCRMKIYSAWI